jgi:hypothetical protein
MVFKQISSPLLLYYYSCDISFRKEFNCVMSNDTQVEANGYERVRVRSERSNTVRTRFHTVAPFRTGSLAIRLDVGSESHEIVRYIHFTKLSKFSLCQRKPAFRNVPFTRCSQKCQINGGCRTVIRDANDLKSIITIEIELSIG